MINRDPKARYWIQVEINSEIGYGAQQYDLSLVDKYSFLRQPDGEVSELIFTYAGVMAPIGLKGPAARFFDKEWMKYVQLKAVQPENTPSLIQVAGVKLK